MPQRTTGPETAPIREGTSAARVFPSASGQQWQRAKGNTKRVRFFHISSHSMSLNMGVQRIATESKPHEGEPHTGDRLAIPASSASTKGCDSDNRRKPQQIHRVID